MIIDNQNVAICSSDLPYTWYGKQLTSKGTYTHREQFANVDCDSVEHILKLDVLPPTEYLPADKAMICWGDTYTWTTDGKVYDKTGTYTHVIKNFLGCDSLVYTLELTELPAVVNKPVEKKYICWGETYTWHGKTYDETTTDTDVVENMLGCDSIIYTLNLTELPEMQTKNESISVCPSELPYTWRGQQLTKSGVYTSYVPFVVNTDCDSLEYVLDFVVKEETKSEKTVTACDSYEWNGKVYTTSGRYTYSTTGANGCDSTAILYLTINRSTYSEEYVTVCYGETYEWNGMEYSQSGSYSYETTTVHGCDSTVILHLTVLPEVQDVEESATICYGDTYYWNGKQYNKNGDYTVTLYDKHGCDYEATLHLTVLPKSQSETTIETCDSYTWNGRTYYESGDYTYVTNNVYGCDSTAILHLTIHHSEETHLYENACDSYTWSTTGETYTESGTYYAMLETSHGCDSIVVLHLTMLANEGAPEYVTICYGETYEWNGQVYDQTGNYSITLTNIYGCDSTAYLYLTILPKMRYEYEEITVCPSELPFVWNGLTLTEAGEYRVREQYTHYDCDRTEYVLTLHVYNFSAPAKVTMPRAICGNPVDVTAATAEIEAYLDAQDLYAPNATVVWQIKNNGRWEAKIHEPVKGSMSEVTVRYVIYSDCGSLQSPEMTVPVEMPTPENDVDMDGISIQSLYGNRIFMLDLNGFVAKFGWKPEPEQVTWYQAVGAVDTYGEQGDDIAVGTGHSYNLPGGAIIVGNYYVVIERIDVSDDDCAAVYRSIVISSVNATSAPRLVPNAVRPSEMMTIKDLDPNQVNEIYVYSTTGELLATYTAEKVREFMLRASHTTGYYIIDVVNNEGKHTLKYIVR
jgi:hypothetical protein